MEERGFEERHRSRHVQIYRRSSAPRYYFSSFYRLLGPDEALAAIASLQPERTVILEKAPSHRSVANQDQDPAVSILDFRRNRYTLALDAPRPGLVYCSESFFRGWTARVNGRPAEILRANFAFRAVEVPAGRVVLELCYWPPGLTSGLIVTSIGCAIALGLLGWDRKRTSAARLDHASSQVYNADGGPVRGMDGVAGSTGRRGSVVPPGDY